MNREWAVFSAVAIVAVMISGILVLGATQGLFGFASASGDDAEVRLQRVITTSGNEYVTADPALAPAAPGLPVASTVAALPDALAAANAEVEFEQSPTFSAPAAQDSLLTYEVGDAGEVTLRLSADDLTVEIVDPAPGWQLLDAVSGNGAVVVTLRGATDDMRFTATIVADEVQVSLVSVPLAAPAPAVAASTSTTYAVGDAGRVTLDIRNGHVTIVSVEAADGWIVSEIEEEHGGVEIEFARSGEEIEFAAVIKDGEIVTFVEAEQDDDDGRAYGRDDDDDDHGRAYGRDDDDDDDHDDGRAYGRDDDDDDDDEQEYDDD